MPTADAFDEFVESLRQTFFALRAVSTEVLADLDCSAVERGILRDVEEQGPQPVPALAQARAVSRQAMQKAVDRLDRAGAPRRGAEPAPPALVPARADAGGQEAPRREQGARAAAPAGVALPISDAELRRTTRALQALGALFTNTDSHAGPR